VFAEEDLKKDDANSVSSNEQPTPSNNPSAREKPPYTSSIVGIVDTSIPLPNALETASLPPTSPLVILGNVRDKFNYASMDCGANVLSVNKEAKEATSVLVGSKDRCIFLMILHSSVFVIVRLNAHIYAQPMCCPQQVHNPRIMRRNWHPYPSANIHHFGYFILRWS
jgi:hypothetical protein